ncbi:MAG: methylated-DNA--[protein]-cysteine S-methyltransferase [Muribaculaceae bacterium]|nr:methylated-DNA--[protein]-cysteine S-methyltransferase [Muribaculaceae bacterium]
MTVSRVILCQGYDAPCGRLLLGAFGNRLCLCAWLTGAVVGAQPYGARRIARVLGATLAPGESAVATLAAAQLDEYFAGLRQQFDVPLLFAGTDFQKRVWHSLADIPFGQVLTYRRQAATLGVETAVRAVAAANGANSLALFAPCHRVIGSDGSLTGYAGSLPIKRFLLAHEGAL